jgi:DNA repair photolyase
MLRSCVCGGRNENCSYCFGRGLIYGDLGDQNRDPDISTKIARVLNKRMKRRIRRKAKLQMSNL